MLDSTSADGRPGEILVSAAERHLPDARGRAFDIFEGTEQIQQLMISQAISGLRIE